VSVNVGLLFATKRAEAEDALTLINVSAAQPLQVAAADGNAFQRRL
jgi:hypothetical protein